MPVVLRDYQRASVDAASKDFDSGFTDVAGVVATGGGKTQIGLALAYEKYLQHGKRVLWIAHREELIHQPVERVAEMYPEWANQLGKVGVVMAGRNEVWGQLIVATVQTLQSQKRLDILAKYGPFGLIVTDEAHHAVAETYLRLLSETRRFSPDLCDLGLTATPIRTDERGLSEVFQKVSFKYGIKELIGRGYLVPFKALAVETGIDISSVKVNKDDFEKGKLARVYDVDNALDLVVASHRKYADGKKAIAFTAGVGGAYLLAQKFRDAGYRAFAVDGETPKEDRRKILADFKAGQVDVLCNCQVFTEGLDLPMLEVAHMFCPTASDLMYMQRAGRVLRPYDAGGKREALILDYVPLQTRNLVLAGDLLGKPKPQRQAEEKAAKAGVVISGFSFTGEGTGIDGDPDQLLTRELNYLSASALSWYYHDRMATLNLGEHEMTVIRQGLPFRKRVARTLVLTRKSDTDGLHRLVLIEKTVRERTETVTVLAKGADYDELARRGDAYAAENGSSDIAGKERAWQAQPVTTKQLDTLTYMNQGTSSAAFDGLTRGEASKLITHLFAREALARYALSRQRTTR